MAIDLNELAAALAQIELRFCVRRHTAADWVTSDEVLMLAEFGLETDTKKMKIGDGVTNWTSLGYWPS